MLGPKILPMHAKILGHTAQISSRFWPCVINLVCVGAQIRSGHLMNMRLQSQQEFTIASKRRSGSECTGRVGNLNTATPGLTPRNLCAMCIWGAPVHLFSSIFWRLYMQS